MARKSAGSYSIVGGGPKKGGPPDPAFAREQQARVLVATGAGAKEVCRKTGVPIEVTRAMVKTWRESQTRKGHKEILNEMLKNTRAMLALAREQYTKSPNSASAYQVQIMLAEQRAVIEHLNKMERPEATALSIIQTALQPMIKAVLRDVVEESRRTMQQCTAIAATPAQREEIEGSFQELMVNMGKLSMDHYGNAGSRVADILKVRQEDVQALALADTKADNPNRIPFPAKGKLIAD